MKKRVFSIGILVVVAIIVAAVLFLFSNLDSLVAEGIRKGGSHATGTDVSVGGVKIAIKDGRGQVTDLAISNPEGFSGRDAFRLGEVVLDLDVESLRDRSPIVIEVVRVANPDVLFELNAKGGSNVDAIRKHAEIVSGKSPGTGEDAKGDGPPVMIRKIQFEKGRISGDASAIGLEAFEMTLPSFTLTNIGGAGGAQPAEIANIIAVALAREVTETIARDKASELFEDKLKDKLGDKVKSLFK
jgi:hypothetical protein